MDSTAIYIASFVIALLASAFLTRVVRDFAVARGCISRATSDRHVHTRPVPRIGGIAIFLSLWVTALLTRWFVIRLGVHALLISSFLLKIMLPASLIFFLGLIDDFIGLGAYAKFTAQAAAAVFLSWEGLGISQLPVLAAHPLWNRIAALALTILWVQWITNAFNLIDGLDGLAAGAALIALLACGSVALLDGNAPVLYLAVVLGGAIAGFLRYNFHPASIFLGDCGSLVIGFLLSGIAMAGVKTSFPISSMAFTVVSLGLPILDLGVAVSRRFLGGRRLFDADREHIHHKLLSLGFSHREAVLVIYGVCVIFGTCSLLLRHAHGWASAILIMTVGMGVYLGLQRLHFREFLELGRAGGRALRQRRVIANGVNVRRTIEILSTCANLPQFCQILQQCLEPIGFDGFGLHLMSKIPRGIDAYPFDRVSGSKLQFFWNQPPATSETNWSLTFRLRNQNGIPLGGFSLYRIDASAPLWLDLDAFTATGFSGAVGAILEKMKDSQRKEIARKRNQKSPYFSPESVLTSGDRDTISLPSSELTFEGNDI